MRYTIEVAGDAVVVEVDAVGAGTYRVKVGDADARLVDARVSAAGVHLHDNQRSVAVRTGARGDALDVHADGLTETLTVLDARAVRLRARRNAAGMGSSGDAVASPMPGRVVQVMVAEGDSVSAGQGVVVVEAMKMENELRAERDGVVAKVHVKVGDTVESSAVLITLEAQDGE